MTRVLVTGGGGFVGQWLARSLVARGDEVILSGLGVLESGPPILADSERKAIRWIGADMRRQQEVDRTVQAARADAIVHLAGVAFPPSAERDPSTAYDVNVLGAARLLSAVEEERRAGVSDPTVLIVGSSTQYGGQEASSMPITEAAEQLPASVYGASKAAQEVIALSRHRATGVRVVCTRSFNHSGVGHGGEYLIPSLVSRARQMRREPGGVFTIGNDVTRDYLHVEDVAAAYIALSERGRPGQVYNVCSGVGISVSELARDVLLHAGLRPDISTDPSLLRATDIPVLVGSPAKLMRDTGWTPRKTHADIIDDLLNAATD